MQPQNAWNVNTTDGNIPKFQSDFFIPVNQSADSTNRVSYYYYNISHAYDFLCLCEQKSLHSQSALWFIIYEDREMGFLERLEIWKETQ